jgi:AraC family transcriptional regulator
MNRKLEIQSVINDIDVFGLSTDPANYNPETDPFEFFTWVQVSTFNNIPDGMVARTVPANKYVQFTFQGPASNAGSVHRYLYGTWLKENDYELCAPYNIEIYGENFKGPEHEDSNTDLLFPIRNK